jgi:hypothetical protein
MAKITFVFVETVFFAVKTVLFLEFRMTKPASVFIPGMPLTPESSLVPLCRIANETGFT